MKKLLSSLDDVEILNESGHPTEVIGYGALSQVRKVRLKSTGKMYAMKEMDLRTIHPNDVKNINREVKTQYLLDHPNIVKLHDNFMAPDQKLYLLLEYCDNNNLFHYIQKSRLDEKAIHKFFYQTVQAIEYIHKRKIMHRDLKPENILLDKNFNVKVCDFGWCAEYNENERRQTLCGTNEYMAPEILLGNAQDLGIDIWALGILLYEMYHKKAPFTGRNPVDIKKAVLAGKLVFKASPMCLEAQDLIKVILQNDPKKRPSIEALYSHPYFHKFPFFRLVSDDIKTIAAKNSRRSYVGGEEKSTINNTLAKRTRVPSPGQARVNGGSTMPTFTSNLTTITEEKSPSKESRFQPASILPKTITSGSTSNIQAPYSTAMAPQNVVIADWRSSPSSQNISFTQSSLTSGPRSLNSSQILTQSGTSIAGQPVATSFGSTPPLSQVSPPLGTAQPTYDFSKKFGSIATTTESKASHYESPKIIGDLPRYSTDPARPSPVNQFGNDKILAGTGTYQSSTVSYQPYAPLQPSYSTSASSTLVLLRTWDVDRHHRPRFRPTVRHHNHW